MTKPTAESIAMHERMAAAMSNEEIVDEFQRVVNSMCEDQMHWSSRVNPYDVMDAEIMKAEIIKRMTR